MFPHIIASFSSSVANNDDGEGKPDKLAALIVHDNDDRSMTEFAALFGELIKVEDMVDMTGAMETADETDEVVAREFTTGEFVTVTVGVVDTGEVICGDVDIVGICYFSIVLISDHLFILLYCFRVGDRSTTFCSQEK